MQTKQATVHYAAHDNVTGRPVFVTVNMEEYAVHYKFVRQDEDGDVEVMDLVYSPKVLVMNLDRTAQLMKDRFCRRKSNGC